MTFKFHTLDDINIKGRGIFLRADINLPLDPVTGFIISDRRIRAVLNTLVELSDAKVVMTSHQGRPGKTDFISLSKHAKIFETYGVKVEFVEDIIGPTAIEKIKKLKAGEILLLENIRFCSEEMIEAPSKELVKTHLIQKLFPYFDLFVNDAFAAVHRSQPSLVAFAEILPTVAGRIMEKELRFLEKIMASPNRPFIVVIGGSKVADKIPAIESLLRIGVADKILVGGLVGEYFLKAKGYFLGSETENILKEEYIQLAKRILSSYEERIVMPEDVAWKENEERIEASIEELREVPLLRDVGEETMRMFSNIIKDAGTVVATGPLGMFELKKFGKGTEELIKAMARSKALTVIGGAHLDVASEKLGLEKELDFISTGGGALIYTISGRKMPVIEALERAYERQKLRKEMHFK